MSGTVSESFRTRRGYASLFAGDKTQEIWCIAWSRERRQQESKQCGF
jgi:hypothetical protein